MTRVGREKTVNVLCAPPAAPNAGMTSVDLAFDSVAKRLGLEHVQYWRLWDQSEWITPVGGSQPTANGGFLDDSTQITYQNLRGRFDEFLDADAVVYWGDFLHMAFYVESNVDILTNKTGLISDVTEARDHVYRTLLLRGVADEHLSRVISYGTTLSFNTPADYAGEYGPALDAFLSRARRVWFRDTYSAWVSQLARASDERLSKGTDAAFLWEPEVKHRPAGNLGVFFGRSALPPEALAHLGKALTTQTGLRPVWLPWGHEPGFWPIDDRRRFRAAWPGLEHRERSPSWALRARTLSEVGRGVRLGPTHRSFSELITQLAQCDVVLTDTYHLAINAWRMGIPTIAVLDEPGTWSVNSGSAGARRDKRAELYSQIEATGLLVAGRDVRRGGRRTARFLVDYLADEAALAVTHERISRLTRGGRRMVSETLSDLLDTP
ncbi:polysaccharide pyruvyl transferase family protein [Pseudactinotalea sp. Z1748]|uniref:polysaccharide pyruvyl transferase family protein n=1 Tax=Pseudactinotalea sp. Z1748 TaxID=3413027 RepID=UPI003C7A50E6